MRTRRLRWLMFLAALGLLAAACGSDREEETSSTTTAAATGSSTTTTTPGVKFGDLNSPCGKGDAKGATAQGVTDTKITIGYGDDRGYVAAPGLNKEMSEAVGALIKWCNEQGGINGRQIEGKSYDAKLLEIDPVITSACKEVFMLVGQGFALDVAQEAKRIGCKLATVPGYSVSAAFAHGAGMAQSTANPSDQAPLQHAYAVAKLFPDAIKKTALMYANYAATIETKDKVVASYPAAGYQFIANCDQVYNIAGESDWKPFAEALKKCGAEIVYFTGSPAPNYQNFLIAAKQVGFAPKAYITDANFYDANFAAWNAGAGAGAGDATYVRMAYVPFEEAAKSPATKQYMDLVASVGKPSLLGAQASASFLLWATAAKACGSNLTSKCVLDEIGKLTNWTAGGLHVPMDPGKNQAPNCGVTLKLTGGKFERVDPKDKTFDCDPKYRATGLKTKALDEAKLDANRIATQFGSFTPA